MSWDRWAMILKVIPHLILKKAHLITLSPRAIFLLEIYLRFRQKNERFRKRKYYVFGQKTLFFNQHLPQKNLTQSLWIINHFWISKVRQRVPSRRTLSAVLPTLRTDGRPLCISPWQPTPSCRSILSSTLPRRSSYIRDMSGFKKGKLVIVNRLRPTDSNLGQESSLPQSYRQSILTCSWIHKRILCLIPWIRKSVILMEDWPSKKCLL